MKKKWMFGALLVVMAALALDDLAGFAQSAMTPPGKLVTSAQWKKMIDDEKPALGGVAGQGARILPPETFMIRRRLPGPNNASLHSKEADGANVTEAYYIIEGSGEQITGGSFDPKNRTAGITGGEKHPFKPGDVVIIPPGTAHWFSKINGHVTYIQVRFPGNVLEAQARPAETGRR
jgi:mannose-6-phosphate isomerase-like protein (cupin superfamily)